MIFLTVRGKTSKGGFSPRGVGIRYSTPAYYIVSMPKIDSFTNEFLELDKKAIPISRSYKENVLQKLAGK